MRRPTIQEEVFAILLELCADASAEAYGAFAYISSIKQNDIIKLLCEEFHVAPIILLGAM